MNPPELNPLEILGAVVLVLLALGWRLSWLATRLDRAHARTERTWAVLDAALVRRAQRSIEAATAPEIDPASTLLVCDAAVGALEADRRDTREAAESTLSQVLAAAALPGLDRAVENVTIARRIHNDAVATARALRRRRTVALFRLSGHASEPDPFEMADLPSAPAPAASIDPSTGRQPSPSVQEGPRLERWNRPAR
ncbi:membrane protein [Microlunatus panaciterrae]|uniref:LemA protein n=1 Tax=Microlunatus panaciterrae TaxID=400768 RepID=A0ABS2RDU4_9ACTN|nr:hypothetical protein [Microlunatus panaciterrae]MBM7797102.1 hypothetical protein [Microlunatus panaciterrae]